MPAELQKTDESDKPAMVTCGTVKSRASISPRAELEKALLQQKIAGTKTAMQTTQPPKSKKTCLCAPTTHAGSFKCRLHRGAAVPKPVGTTSTRQRAVLHILPGKSKLCPERATDGTSKIA